MGIAHLAFNLSLGYQCRYTINYDDINRPAPDQGFGDFKGLLPGIGLRNKQVINIDPAVGCVVGVQSMLGVNIGNRASQFLRFGNYVLGQGGFPR